MGAPVPELKPLHTGETLARIDGCTVILPPGAGPAEVEGVRQVLRAPGWVTDRPEVFTTATYRCAYCRTFFQVGVQRVSCQCGANQDGGK